MKTPEMLIRRLAPTLVGSALLLSAALVPYGPLSAQDDDARSEDADSPRVCDCTFDFAPAPVAFGMNRARLGITLGPDETEAGRSGVRVGDVAEDGPAADAGLLEGDLIVALDGNALGESASTRLLELMGDVEPGDTIEVRFVREGGERTARVVTDRHSGFGYMRSRAPGAVLRRFTPAAPGTRGQDLMAHLRPTRDRAHRLELAEMNEGLGTYFGTSDGVLVTAAAEDSPLGLRSGDVVLSVAGRDVHDPAHLHSILRSYRDDETIELQVMRDNRPMTLTGTVARRGGQNR